MLFVFPDHLIRIQKDLSGSPEMDAMLHEIDPVLLFIPFKGSFRQIYIKMLKHKSLLPVPLYTDATRYTIQFVLHIFGMFEEQSNKNEFIFSLMFTLRHNCATIVS